MAGSRGNSHTHIVYISSTVLHTSTSINTDTQGKSR